MKLRAWQPPVPKNRTRAARRPSALISLIDIVTLLLIYAKRGIRFSALALEKHTRLKHIYSACAASNCISRACTSDFRSYSSLRDGVFHDNYRALIAAAVVHAARGDYAFRRALVFNQDISGWAIDGVEHMAVMFYGASAFDQNLGWCVGDDVFECVGSSTGGNYCEYEAGTAASLPETAFSGSVCAPTMCGVTQGGCPP